MADADPVGKTILQLELFEGVVDREKSYLEIHVVGSPSSQRIPLSELAVRGLSAKEVVQVTHPEIVTDADFIAFISGTDGANGKSAYDLAKDAGFTGTQAEWLTSLTGVDGTDGTDGTNGKSAYEVAVDAGFVGNVAAWLTSLKGTDGNDGADGQSNYDLAVSTGFTGTLAEYLASIKGADGEQGVDGKSAYELAVAGGFEGTEVEWIASLKGKDGLDGDGRNGKSAYELALEGGFVGTEPEWLASLKGADGEAGQDGTVGVDGKSAYEVAVDGGFVGTQPDWLASLKGEDGDAGGDGTAGKSAFQLAQDAGFIGTEAAWLASLQAQLNQANLQALLDQYNWTVKQTLRAKGTEGALSANSMWMDFLFLFDKRINVKDGDINLFDKVNGVPQKVLEAGMMSAEGLAYFKLVDAPGYVKDPARPDNPQSQFFITQTGIFGVGDATDNILMGDGSKITVTVGGVATVYDLANSGGGEPGQDGADGTDGADGKSAYQLAVDLGYEGDEASWLLSLEGTNGTDGTNGKSAYQVAVDGGYVGNQQDWLKTLEGKSAFQIAQNEGFVGNETAWLATLVGPEGPEGPVKVLGTLQGAVDTEAELPPAAEYENSDYFFVGSHVFINANGSWTDLGDFEGPPGKDGTGITVLGSLPGTAYLPATDNRVGDAWLILKSMWVWQGDHWQEQGQVGLKGDTGAQGPEGKNSFETVKAAIPAVDTMAKYIEYIRGIQGAKGDKGDAVVAFVTDGTIATIAELPDPGIESHGWLVGTEPNLEFHVWVDGAWVNMGAIQGPQGIQGFQGEVGPEGPTGPVATPKGELADVADLPTVGNVKGDYYAIDGHFHSWDGLAWNDMGSFAGPAGPEGPEGPVGGPINPKGEVAAEGDLPAVDNVRGDAYEIAGYIYVYDGAAWKRMGQWRGPIGNSGLDGKSAYLIAKDGGFVGSEAEWILSLKGATGETGNTGASGKPFNFISVIPNEAALPVAPAVADTYMIGEIYYTWNGVVWAQVPALKGVDGRSLTFVGDFANQAALPAGTVSQVATAGGRVYMNNGAAWVDVGAVGVKGDKGDDGADGNDGKSAYEVAIDGGFVGDAAAWLASLKGDTGAIGKSLYQDAVDSGAFVGTLPQFIASQKGAPGFSAYEEAIDQGTIPPDTSFDDFLESLRGPIGNDGPAGQTGAAITIIGTLADQAALPAQGVAGTGYAIPDPNNAGIFDCWIWLSTTNTWFNLGHVVGATGPEGPAGPRGLQGLKGNPGDQGTLWLVFGRNPQAQDGRINDYFFNNLTQEFFRKTDAVTWTSLGHIGGGNLNSPVADGKIKGIKDGAWVDLNLINNLPVGDATGVYQMVNGTWVKFDIYTLKVIDVAFVASLATCDWNNARQFRIVNSTTGAKTVALTNLPAADRATTVVVKVYGKVAAFSWTIPAGKGTLRWFDGAPPTFTNDTTTIVFNWDGQEIVGSVPN